MEKHFLKLVFPLGELLVKVKATSVNPLDYFLRSGDGADFIDELPATLHGDVAGVVEQVGEGADGFNEGDAIYACAGGVAGIPGALADYMIVDHELAAAKPQNLTYAEAAALPLVSITAWEGLVDKAKIEEGQKVLVHAAAGGVGHIGLQLAKWQGAEVYTTGSSSEKLDIGLELGAEFAINYKQESPKQYIEQYTNGKGFDLVFNTAGGSNFERSLQAVRLNGSLVVLSTGEDPHQTTNLASTLNYRGISYHGVLMLFPLLLNEGRSHHGDILSQVSRLVEDGIIKPLIDARQFTFNQINEAHAHAASGEQIGKVVLTHPVN